jgi:bilirubin oxidase
MIGLMMLGGSLQLSAQNLLTIPPLLTGTVFNLNVQSGSRTFYDSTSTPTYGVNGAMLAPTIMVNKGDYITLNVTNSLPVKTTMHWHGLHVAAMNDGGPHQVIKPSQTWSPSFTVRNNASTLWYHPHGAGQTDPQVSKGISGLLIIKDSVETALVLPRTYGVDDIPIIVQSKAFDKLLQIAIASDIDTALFVNGTINPYMNAPAQVVRFRLLNGSSQRSYNFGLSNNQTFYQIATDGGLIDTPLALTRLRLSPGERSEILLNFSGMNAQNIFLKSYASEMPSGIYGADSVGFGADTIHGYDDNFLNGADFNLLQINIVSQTSTPITTIPNALAPYTPFNLNTATHARTMVFDTLRLLPLDAPNKAEGPFGINNKSFDIDSVNEIVYLNTTELWTLQNRTSVAHPFHIHDIQFNVVEKNGLPPAPSERGWKDVILVMPHDSVKFITKFETFADSETPYMYHCHLLHHEDDGMMGSFLVIDTTATGVDKVSFESTFSIYPNPTNDSWYMSGKPFTKQTKVILTNALGKIVYELTVEPSHDDIKINIPAARLASGIYFLQISSALHSQTARLIKN